MKSTTVTKLGTAPEERSVDEAVLEATDTVLEASPEEVKVQVVLRRAGSPDRSFVVRFDRAAQLSGVETVEGLPPSILGPLAFPEFLPAAAAAPPLKMLAPGDTWKIDTKPILPGGVEAHFQGTGRLVKVGSSGGQKVASLQSDTRLPLVSFQPGGRGHGRHRRGGDDQRHRQAGPVRRLGAGGVVAHQGRLPGHPHRPRRRRRRPGDGDDDGGGALGDPPAAVSGGGRPRQAVVVVVTLRATSAPSRTMTLAPWVSGTAGEFKAWTAVEGRPRVTAIALASGS